MADESSKNGVKSVQVALDILEAVASAEGEIGVSELAVMLGLTKATVYRHLQTFVDRSYLVQNSSTSRYRLGIQCHLLGQISSARVDLLSASDDVAMQLRDEVRSTVVVSGVRLRSVVVLTTHLGPSPVQIGVRPGSELSLTASAQGRAAIVFSRKPLLAQAKRLERPKLTPRTVTDWAELEVIFDKVRKQGWADSPEEMTLGLNVVAAPIFDDTADCVGTIALIGSIQFLPHSPDKAMIEALLSAAERISIKLGYVSRSTRSTL